MIKIDLAGNLPPNVSTVLVEAYRASMQRSLSGDESIRQLERHQFNGEERDRQAGSLFASVRLGEKPDPSRIVITNGTQSALSVLLHRLVGRGGRLAVEHLTYPAIGQFADMIGFNLVGVGMDEGGLCPDAFAGLCEASPPDALYTTATLQNPTTSILSRERRVRVAEIARQYDVQIIEDDIYSLLPQSVPAPLATFAPERCWYILGTAKGVTAALKVAYVVCPDARCPSDIFWPGFKTTYWMSAPSNAIIASDLIEHGGLMRIVDAVRVETGKRQAFAVQALGHERMRSRPDCLHVWLPLPNRIQAQKLYDDLRSDGIAVNLGHSFEIAGSINVNAIRFGLGKAQSCNQLKKALGAIALRLR